ncbi:MAG: hypothetical protein DWQ19_09465 [Crenarchaeota archaeon]|nr:MAG: hypothetical protein DWQ19_09465 [Thermoproteota archaeon]
MEIFKKLRSDSGVIIVYCKPDKPPTKLAIKKAKSSVAKYAKKGCVEGVCALCEKTTAVASDVSCIKVSGVCGWCSLFLAEKVNYITKSELPTIKEILKISDNGEELGTVEQRILVQHVKEMQNAQTVG